MARSVGYPTPGRPPHPTLNRSRGPSSGYIKRSSKAGMSALYPWATVCRRPVAVIHSPARPPSRRTCLRARSLGADQSDSRLTTLPSARR